MVVLVNSGGCHGGVVGCEGRKSGRILVGVDLVQKEIWQGGLPWTGSIQSVSVSQFSASTSHGAPTNVPLWASASWSASQKKQVGLYVRLTDPVMAAVDSLERMVEEKGGVGRGAQR